jgi:hypothetical protein
MLSTRRSTNGHHRALLRIALILLSASLLGAGIANAGIDGSPAPVAERSVFPPLRVSSMGGTRAEGPAGSNPSVGGGEDVGPSRRKTILYSALLPGLGQLRHGQKTVGTAFLLGEIASWTAYVTYRVQKSNREERYIEHAERFAGIEDADGQADEYYGYLARYDRSGEPGGPDSYNEVEVRQLARDLYPDDLARQQQFIEENSITGAQTWDWESDARRFEYESLRIGAESADHDAEFAIAAMAIGRIVSVMHAIWFTAEPEENEEEASEGSYRPYFDADLARGESRLGVRYRF